MGVNQIQARFWTGEAPVSKDTYTITCEDVDFSKGPAGNPELVKKIKEMYDACGLVLLTNTGVKDIEVLNPFIEILIPKKMVYEGGANSRDSISPNFYEVGAPDIAHLHYHHEMTYVTRSTLMLAFACKHAVDGKGYTFVSENIGATNAILKTELGRKLKEKGICFIRRLTDQREYEGEEQSMIYNHWQKSFGVETEEEAEKFCEGQNLRFEWGRDPRGKAGYLTTRFYTSAFEYFPHLDRNVLYASIADDAMWFDGWPGIMDTRREDRDLKMTFGDDSEITDEERQLWVDTYDAHGIPLEWKQGDLAFVCNYRYAHGRPGFELESGEKRALGVVLGDTFHKVGQKPDKW